MTNRLTDIDTNEVSVVGRAANKRTFVMMKSLGTVAGAQILTSSDGKHTIAKAPGDAPPAVAPPADAGAPPAPPAGDPAMPPTDVPPESPSGVPSMRVAVDIRNEIIARIDAAVAKFGEIRTMLEGAEIVEGVVEIPPEIVQAMNSALDVLETGGPDSAVAKGLKQFSNSRTSSLRAAYTALGEVLAQVETVQAEVVEPQVETVQAEVVEPAADMADVMKSVVADVAKSSDLKSLETSIAKGFAVLVEAVGRQNTAIQKNAEKIGEIESTNRATISTSNAGESAPIAKSEPVPAWPMDMNGPKN